eukprot:6104352-Prymnesium_polylepis.1
MHAPPGLPTVPPQPPAACAAPAPECIVRLYAVSHPRTGLQIKWSTSLQSRNWWMSTKSKCRREWRRRSCRSVRRHIVRQSCTN